MKRLRWNAASKDSFSWTSNTAAVAKRCGLWWLVMPRNAYPFMKKWTLPDELLALGGFFIITGAHKPLVTTLNSLLVAAEPLFQPAMWVSASTLRTSSICVWKKYFLPVVSIVLWIQIRRIFMYYCWLDFAWMKKVRTERKTRIHAHMWFTAWWKQLIFRHHETTPAENPKVKQLMSRSYLVLWLTATEAPRPPPKGNTM